MTKKDMSREVLRLSLFSLVSKGDVPKKHKPSLIGEMLEPDLIALEMAIKHHGVAPFEGAAEIDVEEFKKRITAGGNAVPKQTKQLILTKLRDWLRTKQFTKTLDLVSRGDKVYLVGK